MRLARPVVSLIRVLAYGYSVIPAAILIAGAALFQALGPSHLPLPALFTGDQVRTSVTTFSSLVFALGAIQPATEPAAQLALTGPRSWRLTRLIRMTISVGLAIIVATLTAPDHFTAKTISGLAALAAEGLLVARLGGVRLSWTLPVAHLLAAAVFGAQDSNRAQPWAWFVGTHIPAAAIYLPLAALVLVGAWWASGLPRPEDDELLG